MPPTAEIIRAVAGVDPRSVPDEVIESTEPLVLRGLAADWPMVRAAQESPRAADAYLRRFYQDATVGAFLGAPAIKGRIGNRTRIAAHHDLPDNLLNR